MKMKLKNSMSRFRPLQTLILLLFVQSQAAALPVLCRQEQEVVVSISIRNDSSAVVSFSLKNKRGEWKDFSLAPRLDKPYKDVDEILISTEGGASVHYRLEEESRYVIYWNERRHLWDVVKQDLK
jgi:hypothetical protein